MCDKKATISRGKFSVDVPGLRTMIGPDGCGGVSNIRLEPHGYICVMNAPDKDPEGVSTKAVVPSKNLLSEQNNSEQVFFSDWKMEDLLQSERAGGNALVARLDRMYSQYLTATWLPNTIRQLVNKEIAVRKDMQKLGQPGGDANGLVSITQYTQTIQNGSKEILASLQLDMSSLTSGIFQRLIRCGGATNGGTVQRAEANHATAAKFLSETQASFLKEGKAAVKELLKFFLERRPSKFLLPDPSALKLGRFTDVSRRIDELYAQEVDKIEPDTVAEIERLVRVHFTLPFPAIQMDYIDTSDLSFRGYGPGAPDTSTSVNLVIQVTRIANDLLHAILAPSFTNLEDRLDRCFADVISKPGLWVENCAFNRNRLRAEAGRIEGVLGKILDVIGGPSLTIQSVLRNSNSNRNSTNSNNATTTMSRWMISEESLLDQEAPQSGPFQHIGLKYNSNRGRGGRVSNHLAASNSRRSTNTEGDNSWDVLNKLRRSVT